MQMKSQSYRDLIAWQKALALVTEVYRVTEQLPSHELYGLTSQMRRAAVSVVSNIAEGQARKSRREFLQFLSHAKGSLVEVETQLFVARNLNYVREPQSEALLKQADEVARLVAGLMNSLPSKDAEQHAAAVGSS